MVVFGLFVCLLPTALLICRNGVSILKGNITTFILVPFLFVPIGIAIIIIEGVGQNILTVLQFILFKAVISNHLIILCIPIIGIATHRMAPLIAHKINIYSVEPSMEFVITISLLLEWICKLLFTDFLLGGYQLFILPLVRVFQILLLLSGPSILQSMNFFKKSIFVVVVYIIPILTTILFYLQLDIIGFVLIATTAILWFMMQREHNYA